MANNREPAWGMGEGQVAIDFIRENYGVLFGNKAFSGVRTKGEGGKGGKDIKTEKWRELEMRLKAQ